MFGILIQLHFAKFIICYSYCRNNCLIEHYKSCFCITQCGFDILTELSCFRLITVSSRDLKWPGNLSVSLPRGIPKTSYYILINNNSYYNTLVTFVKFGRFLCQCALFLCCNALFLKGEYHSALFRNGINQFSGFIKRAYQSILSALPALYILIKSAAVIFELELF